MTAWTVELVRDLVHRHQFEPSTFDFKEVLNPTKGADKEKYIDGLRQTVCSMANTAGGYLIFGVLDKKKEPDPNKQVVGIPITGDLRKEFGEKMTGIQQEVFWDASPALPLQSSADTGLFVVRVPRSELRPHMFKNVFWKRTDGGFPLAMDFYEVQERMLFRAERLKKITFLRLELFSWHEFADHLVKAKSAHLLSSAARFDTHAVKSALADCCALIPDDRQLHYLLVVTRAAVVMNNLLDRYSMSPNVSWRLQEQWEIQVRQDAQDLLEALAKSESYLDEIFGPLTRYQEPNAS